MMNASGKFLFTWPHAFCLLEIIKYVLETALPPYQLSFWPVLNLKCPNIFLEITGGHCEFCLSIGNETGGKL